MSRGYKAVRSGDDLARDPQCLKGRNQRKSTIGKQADIRHLEISSQLAFQLTMKSSVIGNPLAFPDFLEQLLKLFQIRKQRRSYCNAPVIHKLKLNYANLQNFISSGTLFCNNLIF